VAVRARSHASAHTTRALLLKRVEYGEADLVLTLFTEKLGRVSALARSARRSQRRFAGSLEPLHTLEVRLEDRPRNELSVLREARIVTARPALTQSLERMKAAGRALGWVRSAAPAHTPEPELWMALEALLDELGAPGGVAPELALAATGLHVLGALGWGLDFERCVRCGKPCPPENAALVDPVRGGLVCRSCGGARRKLDAGVRARLARAAVSGDPRVLEADDAGVALALVEAVLAAHAGVT
jgi:DNA repair protein RecO (recombination protein O)